MGNEISTSSNDTPMNINVFSKNNSCKINVENDLTIYYSSLAKKWAISDSLVNNEDYSAKYYAQNIKQNVENIISEAKTEINDEIIIVKEQVSLAENQVELARQQVSLVKLKGQEQINLAKEQVDLAKQQVVLAETKGSEQVNLAKEQVTLANEAVNEAQEIANNISKNFSNTNLSNINENGKNVIKNLAKEVCSSMPIGTIIPVFCSNNYIPEGCLPCDGNEYSESLFPNFYTNYLINEKICTCSYEEYDTEINTYGKCAKFGIDLENKKFKVPKLADGTFIQQAMLDEKLCKCYNAGLPNITGNFSLGDRCVNLSGQEAFNVPDQSSTYVTGAPISIKGAANTCYFDASLSNEIYGNSTTVQPNSIALRYFIVIANGSINESQIDWSNWAASLSGKMNSDHSNDTKPYIVETYENETSWYRIWSDNWCEQGGEFTAGGVKTLTLLQPYKNTNYQILTTYKNCNNNASITISFGSVNIIDNTTFTIQNSSNTVFTRVWRAVGYIQ